VQLQCFGSCDNFFAVAAFDFATTALFAVDFLLCSIAFCCCGIVFAIPALFSHVAAFLTAMSLAWLSFCCHAIVAYFIVMALQHCFMASRWLVFLVVVLFFVAIALVVEFCCCGPGMTDCCIGRAGFLLPQHCMVGFCCHSNMAVFVSVALFLLPQHCCCGGIGAIVAILFFTAVVLHLYFLFM